MEHRSQYIDWRHQLYFSSILKIRPKALEHDVVRFRKTNLGFITQAPACNEHTILRRIHSDKLPVTFHVRCAQFRHATLSELQMGHLHIIAFSRDSPLVTHIIGTWIYSLISTLHFTANVSYNK